MVECTTLERWHTLNGIGGSNPLPSAFDTLGVMLRKLDSKNVFWIKTPTAIGIKNPPYVAGFFCDRVKQMFAWHLTLLLYLYTISIVIITIIYV